MVLLYDPKGIHIDSVNRCLQNNKKHIISHNIVYIREEHKDIII